MEIRPQPGPQETFLSTEADIAFYGGSAGGGKTCALLMEASRYNSDPSDRNLVLRRETTQIRNPGGLWDESILIYSGLEAEPVETNLKWRFVSGAEIKFNHLEYDKDVFNYQGSQIPYIGFDELTHFTEKQFWYMVSRNRSPHGIPTRIRGTCNPDPDSFVRIMIDWYIDEDGYAISERSGLIRWFIRFDEKLVWADTKEELIALYGTDYQPLSFTFIRSSLDDNKILLEKDPGYRARLMLLSKIDRLRLLGGNWNVRPSAGIFFKQNYFEEVDAHPPLVAIVRAWDRAATEHKIGDSGDPDWTVGLKLGIDSKGIFYVLDIERERYSSLKVEQMILNCARQDGITTVVKLFQDPGSAGKGEAQAMEKTLRGFQIEIESITQNKIIMAKPASAQAEAGNIKVLSTCRHKFEFYRELESFPEGKHDDIVDALSSAFNFLNLDNTGTFTKDLVPKDNKTMFSLKNNKDSW